MADTLYGFDASLIATDSAGNVTAGTTLSVHTTYSGSNPFTATKAVNPVTLLPGASTGGVVTSDSLGRVGFFATDYTGTLYLRQGANSWPVSPTDQAAGIAATVAPLVADKVSNGDMALDLRKQPGVVGNGATDDTAALNTAFASAAALGARAFARGTFRINSTVTIASNADLSDAVFEYYGSGTAVVLGSTVGVTFGIRVLLPQVVCKNKPTTGWTAGTVGVKAVNLNACEQISVPRIQDFETGLLVYGQDQGISYNTFQIGFLANNKRNMFLDANADGWSNQNCFVGGRYGHNSLEGSNVAGTRHILLGVVPNPVNNNTWLNPSVEANTVEQQIDVDGGCYNMFLNPRLERSLGPKVRWGATSFANVIIGGYNASAATITRIPGESRNTIRAGNLFEVYGSSAASVARFQNTSSDAAYSLSLYGAASLDEADYRWRWSAQQLEAKRTAEAFPRLTIDGNNGRYYLGNGAVTPPCYLSAVGTSGISLTGGNLYFGTDNANDVGLISSLRPRYVRAASALVTGSGATGSRPSAVTAGAGATFFDTTLARTVFSDGATWLDPLGSSVAQVESPGVNGLLGWSFDPASILTSTAATTSGTLYGSRVWLPVGATVNNILMFVGTAGATLTAGQSFAGIYSTSGTLLAQTADQSTAWATSGGKTMPLAGGALVLTAGYYDVCWWSVGTTPPRFLGCYAGAGANLGLSAANSRFFTADTGLSTTAPAPRATRVAATITSFAGLV